MLGEVERTGWVREILGTRAKEGSRVVGDVEWILTKKPNPCQRLLREPGDRVASREGIY